jgi:anti-sigma B factor antagonist
MIETVYTADRFSVRNSAADSIDVGGFGRSALDAGTAVNTRTVRIAAYLDGRNVAHVRQQIDQAISGGPGVINLDLRDLDGIDAVGLGMLTAAHLRAEQAGCQLRLYRASPSVRRVLAVTRLNRVLRLDRSGYLTA